MLVVPLLVCAAEPIKREFNLPADTAEKTLKLYSQQSGRALIMGASEVKDIRTREVWGEFTPREALHRMLRDSGLEAVEDAESGSLAVRKSSRQNGNFFGDTFFDLTPEFLVRFGPREMPRRTSAALCPEPIIPGSA